MVYNFSQTSLNRLNGVHPNLVKVMKEAIKNSPFDFMITQGLRTVKDQQALYAKGRTLPGGKVTNCDGVVKKSNHQAKVDGYGYAIDFAIWENGAINWNDSKKYIVVANHIIETGKRLGILIESGAFWKSFKDYPHIELSSAKNIKFK